MRVNSLLPSDFFFWPKRRLNCAGSLMLDVSDNAGPMNDAALGLREPLSRFL